MRNSFAKAVFSFKTKILNPKLNRLFQQTQKDALYADLEELNFKRRQTLVEHAVTHSDFYKKKYKDLGLDTARIKTPADFSKLPPLTREELRKNFKQIKSAKASWYKCRKASTSGSTGKPISVLHDRRQSEAPIRWRILKWWGVEPWENQAFIYRFKKPFLARLANTLLWWPTQRIFLAAANPSPKELAKFAKDFNRIQPTLVQGYVDVVFEFALYLLDQEIEIHPPKMVWVTSAPLFEEQRELIQKAFGAPVCDQYGSTEIMLIAAECKEQHGLHIMQDTVYIEFVDDDNKPVPANTTGRILLTDLTNFAFPIIRYDIGDEGGYIGAVCRCGMQLPLMKNVHGRQAHHIRTPSGLRIKAEHVMLMFAGYMKCFREIQLRQEVDYSVCLEYVPRQENSSVRQVEEMAQLLQQRARLEITVGYKEVQKIQQVGKKTPLIVTHLN